MKRNVIAILLLLISVSSTAQTINDCASEYVLAYRQAQKLKFEKKITEDDADKQLANASVLLDSCIIGKEVNDFELTGLSGDEYSKNAIRGKVVLFNFWSSSCGACIAEIPLLNRISDDYKDKDFVLISILMDGKDDYLRMLERGIVKRKVYFDVIPDSKNFIKNEFGFANLAIPTNLFVDKEGRVYSRVVGASDTKEYESFLRDLIDSKLAER